MILTSIPHIRLQKSHFTELRYHFLKLEIMKMKGTSEVLPLEIKNQWDFKLFQNDGLPPLDEIGFKLLGLPKLKLQSLHLEKKLL